MPGPYIMRKNVSRVNDLRGGGNLGLLGAGNVYRVIAAGEAYYDQFMYDHQFEHTDGSAAVHTTIQSALDATVSARNDYVLVQPKVADYDIEAALTLSKKSVHLIGLDSLYGNGAGNACRVHQTGAYPIALVEQPVEISGFYFKNFATKGGIILVTGSNGLHIHHNYWAMNLSGGTNEPMLGPYIADTGNAGAWSTFEDLFFQSQSGTSATIAAVVRVNDDAVGVRFQRIQIGIGDKNTATYGIQCDSVKGMVLDCDFFAYGTGADKGIFGHCITIHGWAVAYGNRGNVADGVLVEWGGTQHEGLILNFNSASGGTQDEED